LIGQTGHFTGLITGLILDQIESFGPL